jgi:hypothetical protein
MSSDPASQTEGETTTEPGASSLSFTELAHTHEELREEFLAHQELLLTATLEEAWVQLLRYRRKLIKHLKFEESQLLPIYRRDPVLPNGKPAFFLLDHKQILEQMDVLYDRYQEAKAAPEHERPRLLIRLLDAETRYKSLVEHHETREERYLFPRCDEIASEEEREKLLPQIPGHAQLS